VVEVIVSHPPGNEGGAHDEGANQHLFEQQSPRISPREQVQGNHDGIQRHGRPEQQRQEIHGDRQEKVRPAPRLPEPNGEIQHPQKNRGERRFGEQQVVHQNFRSVQRCNQGSYYSDPRLPQRLANFVDGVHRQAPKANHDQLRGVQAGRVPAEDCEDGGEQQRDPGHHVDGVFICRVVGQSAQLQQPDGASRVPFVVAVQVQLQTVMPQGEQANEECQQDDGHRKQTSPQHDSGKKRSNS
jgi:hypothetical protein